MLWALPVPQVALVLSTVIAVPIDSIARADDLSPLVTTMGAVSTLVSVLLLLLSLVALVQRLRRSHGEQRQQLRWLTAAAFALVAGFVLANLAGLGSGEARVWAVVPLFVAYVSVPVAAGVAILRYRLYDIDLVINRAVVGAAVVIFVTVGYVTAVVLLGALVGGRVSEQYWASVVAKPWWRWRSSRCGVACNGWATGSSTDIGRRRTRPWRSCAAAWPKRSPWSRSCRGSRRYPGAASVPQTQRSDWLWWWRRHRRTLADAAHAGRPGHQRALFAAGGGRR